MVFFIDWITAFVKISFQIVFSIVTAIPFYYAWNSVSEKYFKLYIDDVWLSIDYWEMVALLLCGKFLGEVIGTLTPKIVSISQSNDNNKT